MTPAEAIRTHGALGAAHADLHATRAELADAIASLVSSVLTTVAAAQERDRLRARIEAVRAIVDPPGASFVVDRIRAVLDDGPDGAGSLAVPHESADDDASRHPRNPDSHTVNESTTAHPTRMENPR